MDYFNKHFKTLKHKNAFRLTDPIFDDCRDTFRVGCYKEAKYGYILFCENLKTGNIISVFSNTKLKNELEKVTSIYLEEKKLYVPEETFLFSTFGYKNNEYLGNLYRKVFMM